MNGYAQPCIITLFFVFNPDRWRFFQHAYQGSSLHWTSRPGPGRKVRNTELHGFGLI